MINKKEIKENSIELWAIEADKEFKKSLMPMTDEQANAFISCVMNQKEMDIDKDIVEKLEKKQLGYASVFWNRVKYCHTYTVTPSLALFMGGFVCNSFGYVTIYTNYLQYKAHLHNQKNIDIDFISMHCFPIGFPSEEVLKKVWDAQKVERNDYCDSDNLLDYQKCQESISFKD